VIGVRSLVVCSALLAGACGDGSRGGFVASADGGAGDGGAVVLAARYEVSYVLQIEPSATGMQGGLKACKADQGATLDRAPAEPTCDECDATWQGLVTRKASDCMGIDTPPGLSFGLATSGAAIVVWEKDQNGAWQRRGEATRQGAAYPLAWTEKIGGALDLGSATTTMKLTPK